MHIAIPGSLAALGLSAVNASQIGARRPGPTPSGEALEQLAEAMDNRISQIAPDAPRPELGLGLNTPPADASLLKIMRNTSPYASNGKRVTGDGFDIDINPNADRSYLAHELGHVASAQTKPGGLIRSARNNPALSRSLGSAALLGAGGSAALIDGDDDLATSIALAYAGSIPQIADEILATKNGLAIMNDAGMRATAGQRGRMAGGLVTYLAGPLLLGATANLVGNQFDEEPRSTGEIQPT